MPPPSSVSCCFSLPSGRIFQRLRSPLRGEKNAIQSPRGDQRGTRSTESPVNCISPVLSVRIL